MLTGGSARDGDDVYAAGGGVDPAHGQWPGADTVLFGQGVGNVGAERQRGSLSSGHPRGIEAGGIYHRSPPALTRAIAMCFCSMWFSFRQGRGLVPVPVGLRILTTVHS